MISATLSASDLDELRMNMPLELEIFDGIPAGTIVDLEFGSRTMRMIRASDGHELLYFWGTVEKDSAEATAQFDVAHLLERVDFVQNLHPRPRGATVRLEQRDGDPRWWVSVEGAEPVALYPASLSGGRATVVEWREIGDTTGWISERANRAVFDFSTDIIDVLANLPADEKVTFVFAESTAMYSTTTVLVRNDAGQEIAVPVRFNGTPTQMSFEVGYLLDKYLALCQKFDSGVAQLGLFWSRDSERDWYAAARWADKREFEWVSAVYGSVTDPVSTPSASAPAFCPSCGAAFGEGANFCASCGAAR